MGVIAPGDRRNGDGPYTAPPAARLVNPRKSRPVPERGRVVVKAAIGVKIRYERDSARTGAIRESTRRPRGSWHFHADQPNDRTRMGKG